MGRRLFKYLKTFINCIIGLIYCGAESCILCNEYSEDAICEGCKPTLKSYNLSYVIGEKNEEYKCFSIGYYSYGVKKLILKFKYEKSFLAGDVLAQLVSNFILKEIKDKVDILTFVPSSKKALRERGFNQCEVICSNVSRLTNIPYKSLLKKLKETKDQIGLSTLERWNNIANSFTYENIDHIRNQKILLIDDVLTTGATAFHCAKMLKSHGAKEIYILTVAKSRV